MVEFRKLAQTYRLDLNGKSADVWQLGRRGWSWNVLDAATGTYLACGRELASCDAACEQALAAIEA
jgi:hypothetical protein